jgi:hypothetical protein
MTTTTYVYLLMVPFSGFLRNLRNLRINADGPNEGRSNALLQAAGALCYSGPALANTRSRFFSR